LYITELPCGDSSLSKDVGFEDGMFRTGAKTTDGSSSTTPGIMRHKSARSDIKNRC